MTGVPGSTLNLARWSLIIAAAGLSVWGLLRVPDQAVEQAVLPSLESDPYVVCPAPVAGGGFSSRLGVASRDPGKIGVVGGGTGPLETPGDGAFVTEVGDLAELGTTPILVETSGTAATYTRAGTVAAMAGCIPASAGPQAIMGMSTAEGDRSTIVLVNPFAAEALVRLIGASEFGVDTPTALDEMTVPPATAVEIPLDRSMAGRQSLSFAVVADSGLVAVGMHRSGPIDVAAAEATEGSIKWFFALPDFGFDGEIHLRSLADVDTPFRVDRIQPDGLVEGVIEDVLPAQSLSVIPVEEVAGPGSGIVVSSAEPVAAVIVYAIDDIRAVAPGVGGESTRWSVPVSATLNEGQETLWILNTSEEALTASIERLGVPAIRTVELPAGITTGIFVTGATGGGIEVSADGPIIVFYGVLSGNSIGLGAAVPIE